MSTPLVLIVNEMLYSSREASSLGLSESQASSSHPSSLSPSPELDKPKLRTRNGDQ